MSKRRHTYRFDPHLLRYEKVFVSLKERVRRISFSILFGVVIGVVLVVVALQFMESPQTRLMRRQLAQYKQQTALLNDRVERAERVLENLEERDDALYRVIFESEPVSPAYRHSGIGGEERYAIFDSLRDGGVLKKTSMRVDALTKRLYVESRSMDEIYAMAKTKNERMSAMPAILPIKKSQCKVESGYGMRYHPILKTQRMHSGMDLTARPGTPIYATGNGVVREAGRNIRGYTGYGNVVVIDHGFGFVTLYAHMKSINTRVGRRVKRGEKIGTVGSSGMSAGSHLHYEVLLNGKNVDPVYYFFNDLTPQEYDEVIEQAQQENQCMS